MEPVLTRERLQEIKRFFNDKAYLAGGSRAMEGGIIWELLGVIEKLEAACREKDEQIVGRVRDSVGYQSETAYVLERRIADLEATVERLQQWHEESKESLQSAANVCADQQKEVERLTRELAEIQDARGIEQRRLYNCKDDLTVEKLYTTTLKQENARLRDALQGLLNYALDNPCGIIYSSNPAVVGARAALREEKP